MPRNARAVSTRDAYAELIRADPVPTHSTADAEEHQAVKQQIVEYYRASPAPLTLRKLADALQVKQDRVGGSVAELVFTGHLHYTAAPRGRAGTYGPTGKVAA